MNVEGLTASLVVGDVISIDGMATNFEKVYHKKPQLEPLGSLEDLRTKMIEERQKYGADLFKSIF